MSQVMVGIIGGTGLGDALPTMGKTQLHEVDTPFGRPSTAILTAQIEGVSVALLSRHGVGHLLNPSHVPYRANIFALKKLGVTHILASAAVGSLRDEIAPKHLVIADQIIDKTFRRPGTFFEELAVHVEFASPFCPTLRRVLQETAGSVATQVHPRGTYVCMEGPQFSTRAESELHRSWGAHLIGMTVVPEAKLAREAEICYALIALPTDYDCWKPHPTNAEPAQVLQEIISNLKGVTEHGLSLIRHSLPAIQKLTTPCSCQSALALGIWSDRTRVPVEVRRKLAPLLGKYLPA